MELGTDVQPAESSPVVEAAPLVPESPVYDMDSMDKDQRQALIAKGQFPKRVEKVAAKSTVPPAETKPAESSPEAQKGPEGAPGDDEEEKLTPAERRKANRNLRTELERANERAKVYQEELAALRGSAPAPRKDAEPVKPAVSQPKPRPNPSHFTGTTADEAWEKYVVAENEWMADEITRRAADIVEARFAKESAKATAEKSVGTWNSQVQAAKAEYKDYDAVVGKLTVTPVLNEALTGHKDGAKISYWLGLPENAADLKSFIEETQVDGMNFEQLAAACAKNPGIRDRVLLAKGMAIAELNRIAMKLANPPAEVPPTPQPKEKTSTNMPPPAKAINGNAAAVVDPVAQALKSGNMAEYNRLQNERVFQRRFGNSR